MMFKLEASEIQTLVATTVLGLVIGAFYTQIAYLSQPDAQGTLWLGMGIGASIGFFITFFEIVFVGRPNSYIRQLPFLVSLVLRAFIHIEIIFFSINAWQIIFRKITGVELDLITQDFGGLAQDLGVSMVIVTVIIFYMQMRVFIGSKTLRNLVLGKYNRPQQEERIFMIVDVVGSTSYAQKKGDVTFHKFLNRIFMLMDGPIHSFGGEVHSYVGDAVFSVWPVTNDRNKDARPLEALIAIQKLLNKRSEEIEKTFGQKPEIRVALHKGSVVIGETGHRKRQITYLGNTVNLASRIETLTKTAAGNTLASSEYLRGVDLPNGLRATELGAFDVKGSSEPLYLSSLERSVA